MTDEYRMFLESRCSEESDRQEVRHSDVPHWKPSVISTNLNNEDHLEHYGVKGMKWGVIHEEEKYGKSIGDTIKDTFGGSSDHKKAEESGMFKASARLVSAQGENPEKLKKEKALSVVDGISSFVDNVSKYDDKLKYVESKSMAVNLFNSLAGNYEKKFGDLKTSESYIHLGYASANLYESPDDPEYLEKFNKAADEFCAQVLDASDLSTDPEVIKKLRDLFVKMDIIPHEDENMLKEQLKGVSVKDVQKAREHHEKDKEVEHSSFNPDEFLAHHGVKGMKWGIRRYQNEDGTRIDAKPREKKEQYNSKTLQYKKKAQHLTDEELDARNRRMQKEVQYNQLRKTLQPKTKAERRREIRNQIFVATMSTAAAAVMTAIYKKALTSFIDKASRGKIKISGK